MSDLKISATGEKIMVSATDISFGVGKGLKNRDNLVISYSYDLKNPLTIVPFSISYSPSSDEKMLLTALKLYKGKRSEDKKFFVEIGKSGKPYDGSIYPTHDGFRSTEVVAKLDDSCMVLGFFSGADENKLKLFKSSASFAEKKIEALSH